MMYISMIVPTCAPTAERACQASCPPRGRAADARAGGRGCGAPRARSEQSAARPPPPARAHAAALRLAGGGRLAGAARRVHMLEACLDATRRGSAPLAGRWGAREGQRTAGAAEAEQADQEANVRVHDAERQHGQALHPRRAAFGAGRARAECFWVGPVRCLGRLHGREPGLLEGRMAGCAGSAVACAPFIRVLVNSRQTERTYEGSCHASAS